MRAGENRSDVEAELESEEPMEMGGDASSFEDGGGRDAVVTSVEHCDLRLHPSAVGGTQRGVAMFLSQGSATRVKTLPLNERRSGRGRRVLQRRRWLHTPLLQVWWSTPAGRRNMFVPLHLRGRRWCVTHNVGMPCQLLWWVCHEPVVAVALGPIGNRPG